MGYCIFFHHFFIVHTSSQGTNNNSYRSARTFDYWFTRSDLGFEIQYFGEKIKVIEEEKEKIVPIKIYFQFRESEESDTNFNPERVLFSFKDVRNQFSELLSLWQKDSQNLGSIIDLYVRLTYIPKRHINDFSKFCLSYRDISQSRTLWKIHRRKDL